MGVEDYDDYNFLGDDWKWDQWTTIGGYDDDVPGPPMSDHYNEIHVLKPRFSEIFDTIIQCFFKFISMNLELFQILACQ